MILNFLISKVGIIFTVVTVVVSLSVITYVKCLPQWCSVDAQKFQFLLFFKRDSSVMLILLTVVIASAVMTSTR